jgi:hypothetical protein
MIILPFSKWQLGLPGIYPRKRHTHGLSRGRSASSDGMAALPERHVAACASEKRIVSIVLPAAETAVTRWVLL